MKTDIRWYLCWHLHKSVFLPDEKISLKGVLEKAVVSRLTVCIISLRRADPYPFPCSAPNVATVMSLKERCTWLIVKCNSRVLTLGDLPFRSDVLFLALTWEREDISVNRLRFQLKITKFSFHQVFASSGSLLKNSWNPRHLWASLDVSYHWVVSHNIS